MKLKYIFTALVASLAFLLVGCQEEERFLEEVQVSQSTIAIPMAGGEVKITVTAVADWNITSSIDSIPAWLTVNPLNGPAGETEVVFSAGATNSNNEVLLYINCSGVSQILNVRQAEKVSTITSCADVLAEQTVGKTYRVKGAVTDITNYDKYGCFYVNDGTSDKDVYVYGSMNSDKFNVEVGDIVTFEGPWTSYGNFDDVSILELEKSYIKLDSIPNTVDSIAATLPIEGGQCKAYITTKTGGVNVVIPEEAKTWLSVEGISISGTAGIVTFNAAANSLGDRKATITFTTENDGQTYSTTGTISQKGAIVDLTAAEINAAEDGDAIYRLTGVITGDQGNEYGNIYVADFSGEVYVYGVLDAEGKSKQWKNMGINVGDIVTITGPKTSYKGDPQLKNASVEAHKEVKDLTVAEFLAAAESKDVYYQLTGTVKNLVMDEDDPTTPNKYGNFDIVDGTGSVYVYGLLQGWGGPSKKFNEMGIKEGDTITIIGYRTGYKGTPQVGGAFNVVYRSDAE